MRVSAGVVPALVLAALSVPAPALSDAVEAADEAPWIQVLDTDAHDPGFPATSDPSRTLQHVHLIADEAGHLQRIAIDYVFDPDLAPADVEVTYGDHGPGGDCVGDQTLLLPYNGDLADGNSWRLETLVNVVEHECATVALVPSGGGPAYDRMSGDLVSDYTNPTLRVTNPRLELARGTWSLVELSVARESRSRATVLGEVGGHGKGYRIDRKVLKVEEYMGWCEPSCWVKVKVDRDRSRLPIDFLAYDRGMRRVGEVRRSVVPIDVVEPPRLPPGKYAGVDGTRFKISKGGKITDFSAKLTLRGCYGLPTYQQAISTKRPFTLYGNGVAQGTRPTFSAVFEVVRERARVQVHFYGQQCNQELTLDAVRKRP